jgi:hypothetical protein
MAQGQGSTGNVIAAICSLFFPGLGQLLQGRVLSALFWLGLGCFLGFLLSALTLFIVPLWAVSWFVVGIFSCISAARYRSTN